MMKKLFAAALLMVGFATTAEARPPIYGGYYGAGYRPFYSVPTYGYRYYATPYAGYAYRYAAAGPYYNYGYSYYARPVVPVAPVYYGPRVGIGYVTPRYGIYGGF